MSEWQSGYDVVLCDNVVKMLWCGVCMLAIICSYAVSLSTWYVSQTDTHTHTQINKQINKQIHSLTHSTLTHAAFLMLEWTDVRDISLTLLLPLGLIAYILSVVSMNYFVLLPQDRISIIILCTFFVLKRDIKCAPRWMFTRK